VARIARVGALLFLALKDNRMLGYLLASLGAG